MAYMLAAKNWPVDGYWLLSQCVSAFVGCSFVVHSERHQKKDHESVLMPRFITERLTSLSALRTLFLCWKLKLYSKFELNSELYVCVFLFQAKSPSL